MKFDYCIGNPPYQETKGGTKNVDVWPSFVEGANTVAKDVCLIHPGRWVNPKKQMVATHNIILNSGLTGFKYYPNASDIFNGVSIDGGVTVTMFREGYSGDVKYSVNGNDKGIFRDDEKFFSNEFEEEAYNKIFVTMNTKDISHRILGNIGSLASSEFGYSKHTQIDKLTDDASTLSNPIAIWANSSYGKGTRFAWHYIDESELKNVPDGLLTHRKVMLDKKGHSIVHGKGNIFNNIPKIVKAKATASGDVLFVLPDNDTDYELQLIKSFFMTKTVRFLMSISQKDLYVRGFENVPDYVSFVQMLNGNLFTDKFFNDTFGLSSELISHIDRYVSDKADNTKEIN